jgi:UDP-2,3-diacylglucosamine pyrophosphatase LpxH
MLKTHTLVLSDLHLGSGVCSTEAVLKAITKIDYKRIIIAGDLYEKGSEISWQNRAILEHLKTTQKEVVIIKGNHDPSPKNHFWQGLPRPIKGFSWTAGNKKLCAMHGHQFDRFCFIFDERWVDKLFLAGISFACRMQANIAGWIDGFHNGFSRHVIKRAVRYASKHGYDTVICGHTHKPAHLQINDPKHRKSVEYINTGCCVNGLCFAATISKDGRTELLSIPIEQQSQRQIIGFA